jgi:hypothetical protein
MSPHPTSPQRTRLSMVTSRSDYGDSGRRIGKTGAL